MPVKPIRLLGDPGLGKICKAVDDPTTAKNTKTVRDLRDTLADFRKKNGFGRGIAAPQIGVLQRIIYIYFQKAKLDGALINPEIIKMSKAKIRLWDDCFSFPGLLVKVERAKEIVIEYRDAKRKKRRLIARDDLSELLQHEIDHLDGILAIERAINGKSFSLRAEWKKFKNKTERRVQGAHP